MKRMGRAAWAVLVLAFCGCSSERPVVVLLSQVPERANRAVVLVARGDQVASNAPEFDLSRCAKGQAETGCSLGLWVPLLPASEVRIAVGVFNAMNCLIATGEQSLALLEAESASTVGIKFETSDTYPDQPCLPDEPRILRAETDVDTGETMRLAGWRLHPQAQLTLDDQAVPEITERSFTHATARLPFLKSPSGRRVVSVAELYPTGLRVSYEFAVNTLTFEPLKDNSYALTGMLTATGLAVGDLDRDGFPDVVTVGKQTETSGYVAIFRNLGNGKLAPPQVINLINTAHAIAVGDLNQDGWMDLAITSVSANAIFVFSNNQQGQFPTTGWSQIQNIPEPEGLAIADMNQDARPDMVAVSNSTSLQYPRLYFALNQGTSFSTVHISIPDTLLLGGLAVPDLNVDGLPDLVVTGTGISTQNNKTTAVGLLWPFTNKGGGLFVKRSLPYSPSGVISDLAVGDFNQDGSPDIATSGIGVEGGENQNVRLFFNQGAIGSGGVAFAEPPVETPANPRPYTMASGDLNNDGRMDLVVTSPQDHVAGLVAVLMSQGVGQFPSGLIPSYPIGVGPTRVVAADFNLDGLLDFVVVTYGDESIRIGPALRLFLQAPRK